MNIEKYKSYIIFFLFICLFLQKTFCEDKYFVIIVPSYNNEEWCVQNLESIFSQDYPYFHVIYINDASTDKTGEMVQTYLQTHNLQNKCTYIENRENKKALHNIYHAIHMCNDSSIICLVDGDDWLAHNHVLTYLNNIYQDTSVWITYGQFIRASGYEQAPQSPYHPRLQHIRTDLPNATHLKTFYAGLFKLINPAHLMYNNLFFPTTYDVAMMLPMLEMADFNFKCVDEVLYVYNDLNSLNDNKKYPYLQFFYDFYTRNLPPYQPLQRLTVDALNYTHALVLFVDVYIEPEKLVEKIDSFKKSLSLSTIILLIDSQNDHLKQYESTILEECKIVWYDNNTNPYMGRMQINPLYNLWFNWIENDTISQSVIIGTTSSSTPSSFDSTFFNKGNILLYGNKEVSCPLSIVYKDNQLFFPLEKPCLFFIRKELFRRLRPGTFYINSFLSFRTATESCFSKYPSFVFSDI